MPTQSEINQMEDLADKVWNVYQTVEDMQLKMQNCDDITDFKNNISMDSFDAILQVLKEIGRESKFRNAEQFEAETIDGGSAGKIGLDQLQPSILTVVKKFEDYLNYIHHELPLSDASLKDFENKLMEWKRKYLFVILSYCETVKKVEPDEDKGTGGEKSIFTKSIKRILDVESAGLTPNGQDVVNKFIFDFPDLVAEYKTLGDELHVKQYDTDLMRLFRDTAVEITEATYDVYQVFVKEGLKHNAPDSLLDAHDRVVMMIDDVEFLMDKPNRFWDNGDTDKHFQKSLQVLNRITDDLRSTLAAMAQVDPTLA